MRPVFGGDARTPLLIQLYVLYYGLPNLGIHLNAFVAAVLGWVSTTPRTNPKYTGRASSRCPRGQEEAARSLGVVHGANPVARRFAAGRADDFAAVDERLHRPFKDTSLVSIITVTELTRAYGQAATATYRFLELGLLGGAVSRDEFAAFDLFPLLGAATPCCALTSRV